MNAIISAVIQKMTSNISARTLLTNMDLHLSNESLCAKEESVYQAENIFNQFLPYAEKLDNEANDFLAKIKANFGRCVMLRDINPGCIYWSQMLNNYIDLYGLRFTKEEHVSFIKMTFALMTIPNLEPSTVETFGKLLLFLLKKKETLSPEDLGLEWRPLYDLCRPVVINKFRLHRYPATFQRTLEHVVFASKSYFPPNATQEILDELRPKLCPLDLQVISDTFKLLRWFLPVDLPVKYHNIGHELWFHEFMKFWEVCHNERRWENELMHLMASLASNNIGYLDWNPYIPLMFTRIIRSLKLPVNYKKIPVQKHYNINMKDIGIWIASILGDHSNAQTYLDKFMKTLETYFHSANYGPWLVNLETLLLQINYFVAKRIRRERYAETSWETPIPDGHKLTDANIDAFVNSMMPVTMTAIFNTCCSENFFNSLQYLATIRPNIVITKVQEKLFPTLGTDIEPHKAATVMSSIFAVCRPLVIGSNHVNKDYAFTEGSAYALSILYSCLPSIDVNDPNKCFITLRLIAALASLIPIVDCSKTKGEKSENEEIACGETSRFEDFVLQLMEKIFTLIDSTSLEFVRLESQSDDGKKSSLELMAESSVYDLFRVLLLQTSNSIFTTALNKLRAFIESSSLETKIAGQLVAVICKAFSTVNAQQTIRTLLPDLADKILEAIGQGDDVINEENLDNQLLYSLLLLQKVVDTQGDALLPYMDTILDVLDKVTRLKNREGYLMGCQMLKNVLTSLCNVHSVRLDRNLDDPEYPYWKDWAKSVDFDSAKIRWYVPGDQEIIVAQKIFVRYLLPELNSIQNYVANPEALSRDELQRTLRVINAVIEGCDLVLPVLSEPALVTKPFESCVATFEPNLGNKYKIKMPDGSNVRLYLVQIMTNLQEIMLNNIEDDTKSFSVLVQIWQNLLTNKSMMFTLAMRMRRRQFCVTKKSLEDKVIGDKGYLPPVLLERAEMQHNLRKIYSVHPLTETSKSIIMNLFKLSISQYSAIRIRAQHVVWCAFENYPNAYQILTPHIMEVLGRDTEKHHDAYKGVLFLIVSSQSDTLVKKRNWQLFSNLLPALVLSKPSEKLSIIKQQDVIIASVTKSFTTTNITLEVPNSCVSIASEMWKSGVEPTLSLPNQNEIEKGVNRLRKLGEDNLKAYYETSEKLLNAILEKNLHWRHRQLAMHFMSALVHPDVLSSAQVVRYFLGALIHDSIDERKMALNVVALIFKQLKRKHPKIELNVANQQTDLKPGLRTDNAWLQYVHEKCPKTAEQWDEPRYVHKKSVGYYVWPKKIEVYAPSSQQPPFDKSHRQLSEQEQEVERFFDDEQNVAKFIKFLSLEEKKGKDCFNSTRFYFFKGLFRNHGDSFLSNFLPHLHNMVQVKQESVQRCAAEIISGLIRGTKHWTFQMTKDMWQNLLPIVRLVLSNVTEETVNDWITCFTTATSKRDAMRQHWLIECLIDEFELAQSEVSFIECARLQILQSLLKTQKWRINELLNRLLSRFESRLLENPLDNVRDQLALILVTIFSTDITFSDEQDVEVQGPPKMEDFVDKVYEKLEPLLTAEDIKSPTFVKTTRLLNTICTWIQESIAFSHLVTTSSFYKLYPIISKLENDDNDEELARNCSKTLAMLAPTFILPVHMPKVLQTIDEMSRNLSWSARTGCVQFLEVLLFHNMNTLLSNDQWIGKVMEIVLRLLQDERVEVREKSAQVLNGLLHCTLIPDRQALLEEFKKMAKTKLRSKKTEPSSTNINNAIRLRHAGVLGMCAFIQAHPYDIPKDVPPIFEYLSLHLNDPEPIPTTIRKTLNDFKRTHCDGWTGLQGLAQDLTEEQFALLQDLTMPPSYYA